MKWSLCFLSPVFFLFQLAIASASARNFLPPSSTISSSSLIDSSSTSDNFQTSITSTDSNLTSSALSSNSSANLLSSTLTPSVSTPNVTIKPLQTSIKVVKRKHKQKEKQTNTQCHEQFLTNMENHKKHKSQPQISDSVPHREQTETTKAETTKAETTRAETTLNDNALSLIGNYDDSE